MFILGCYNATSIQQKSIYFFVQEASQNIIMLCNCSGIQFQEGPRPQKSFVSKRGVLLFLSIRAWTIDCTVGQHTFPAFSSPFLINFGVMFSVQCVCYNGGLGQSQLLLLPAFCFSETLAQEVVCVGVFDWRGHPTEKNTYLC